MRTKIRCSKTSSAVIQYTSGLTLLELSKNAGASNFGANPELVEENKRLKKRITVLENEVATKETIIRTLDKGSGNQKNPADL